MTATLADRIGIGQHELISIVGAGGKTTILRSLGRELASRDRKVILATTTKMAADQIMEPVCWSDNPATVEAELFSGTPLMVMRGRIPGKVTGLSADAVDRLFVDTSADYILVEADGARSMSIKAPADHEPAIPGRSTLVIVVVGADALGKPLGDVAHRPELIATLTGANVDAIITVELAAAILLHPEGGLKRVPENARIVMAITKVSADNGGAVAGLVTELSHHPDVDRVVTWPAEDR